MANSREKKTRNVFTEKAALEQEIAALKESLKEQAARLAQCRKEIEDAIVARIKRQALHAARLHFRHPMTGAEIDVQVPLPSDMAQIVSDFQR